MIRQIRMRAPSSEQKLAQERTTQYAHEVPDIESHDGEHAANCVNDYETGRVLRGSEVALTASMQRQPTLLRQRLSPSQHSVETVEWLNR